MGDKIKLGKKTISLKTYLPLCFLRQIPQTFRKCSLIYLENSLGRNFKKFKKKLKKTKKQFFLLIFFSFKFLLLTECTKYYKGTYPKSLRYLSQKTQEEQIFSEIVFFQFQFAPPIRNPQQSPTFTCYISKTILNFLNF